MSYILKPYPQRTRVVKGAEFYSRAELCTGVYACACNTCSGCGAWGRNTGQLMVGGWLSPAPHQG